VGWKAGNAADVFALTPDEGRGPWSGALHRLVDKLSGAGRALDEIRGVESFRYPASRRLLSLPPRQPDVVHAHNLHGGYFDLRALPELSRRVPVVLTLHDAWMLSGHCAHSFDCERWQTGCGHCPDLTIYPAIRRDRTAPNWRRKRDLYGRSRLWVATPSRWLMDRVERSMLAPAIAGARVIPNGVDLSVFRPASRAAARAALGLPAEVCVLLFAASGARSNEFKDFRLLRAAAARVAEQLEGRDVVLAALGEAGPVEWAGGAEIRFAPFEEDPEGVALWYQAADVYLHAARADTFPTTVVEALACGTPVVATAVGGIPEQVRSLEVDRRAGAWAGHDLDAATGVLTPAGDDGAMAAAALRLLGEQDLRHRLGENAARDARNRFDVEAQCLAYLDWYEEILVVAKREAVAGAPRDGGGAPA
jgi:glycosyltransferase involved in cell wall biosynthesis